MKLIWKNETRKGKWAESKTQAGNLRLSIHSHIHYPTGTLLGSCYGAVTLELQTLEATDVESAKLEFVDKVRDFLWKQINALGFKTMRSEPFEIEFDDEVNA
jgi:hypothetical protein